MAIARTMGKSSLFITFTANPRWPGVLRHLEHNQTPNSRPDLIGMVFAQKLKALMHDLTKRQVFGKCIGNVFTVEYQKRGLPHAHILLFLQQDDVPLCADHVDQLIQASMLAYDPSLAELVKNHMVHGPCGQRYPNSPCMKNGKCSKHYPKKWCEQTSLTEGSYPEYKRPHDGQTWGGDRFSFDNRWVVPHNPFLLKKYGAHINVEVAKGVHTIKYLAKYVYKGSDRATLQIGNRYDEIKMTLQGRYFGSPEAYHRLMAFPTHQEKPAVMILPFHLEERHRVDFGANLITEQLALAANTQSSAFLDWMKFNANNTSGRDLLYSDFPMLYTYVKERGWHSRVSGKTIGRMPVAHPSQRDHFYLRMLLTVKPGAKSYQDLYMIDGISHSSPSAACLALGLIADDTEWVSFFNQIKDTASGPSLRRTLATIISNSTITSPQLIWDKFRDNFTDDCLFHLRNHGNFSNPPPSEWSEEECKYDYGLWLLGGVLCDLGRDWHYAKMTGPTHIWVELEIDTNHLITEALDHNREEERRLNQSAISIFNHGQQQAYEKITNAIENNLPANTFFLQGPAGTGKTFLYKALCNLYRAQCKIVLCVASSGIASLLLPSGRTSHSMFKIPINSNEDSRCRITGNSDLAKLLIRTHLIIWDEVTLQSKHDFAAVDKTLRSILHKDDLFGGIPVVLGGDFAQILPVVRRGRREQVVNACIQSWTEWPHVQPLFLTQNMRVIEDNLNQRYAAWLSILSYTKELNGVIDLPNWIRTTDDRNEFREFMYAERQLREVEVRLFYNRAILSSRNDSVESFNNDIADLRGSESHEYLSVDHVQNDEGNHISDYPSEFLQTISGPGFPPGKLTLQIGMPVMLCRNIHPRESLCNGTRLIITQLFTHGIKDRIISTVSTFNSQEHFIHRINMTYDDNLPFTLLRTQLPLRPCFSMTINKSQGQTLNRVGVDLSTPVFTHGQLYVALSRVTDVKSLIVLLPRGSRDKRTVNIVYPEVLLQIESSNN